MVNGKMCVSVSKDELMCRFDPALQETAAQKKGFRTMVMKGRELKGYGYIIQEGIKSKKDFDFWINLPLSALHYKKPSTMRLFFSIKPGKNNSNIADTEWHSS